MDTLCTLSALKPGETARVKKLRSCGSLRRRLLDIGLIEGTNVECVLKSPGGDPTAYRIRGALIALRFENASEILVVRG